MSLDGEKLNGNDIHVNFLNILVQNDKIGIKKKNSFKNDKIFSSQNWWPKNKNDK